LLRYSDINSNRIPIDYNIESLFFTFVIGNSTLGLKNGIKSSLLFLFLLLLVANCSIEQNSVTSNIYHNTTAHFNGYFYAREKTREVEKVILKSLDDDHNQILRLFPKLDTVLAKSYSKDTEEIIKMASLSIQRHPNSRWVYQDYILVGLARLYSCDFQNAVQTFKYVNTKSKDPFIRHQALVHLIRTFTEQGEFDKADEAIRFLEKEKLSKVNRKNLYLEKAYLSQVRDNYDMMVRSLTQADSLITKKDRKDRVYFIIGQVYQKLGFGAEAYNYYRKCLSMHPEYEIDFYARLNMAQVAQLNDSRDIKIVRKQFKKLLTDAKNAEFKDKIYFELGEFERKQNHLNEAIGNYQLAAHAGKNKRIQGSAYLRSGQLYFDSLKKYELAKAYYDSAITSLPKEYEGYDAIKKRQEVLADFVKYTQTIQWQDSLLAMAKLDSVTLRGKLDLAIAARNKPETGKKRKRRAATTDNGNSDSNNPFFQNNGNGTNEEVDWYFGNPSAVGLGQTEFQRVWGSIILEDNWRRSNKSISVTVVQTRESSSGNQKSQEETSQQKKETVDPSVQVFQELPKTDQQKKEALAKIEEAYFKLGDLYYLQLSQKPDAADLYKKLLNRFPETEYTPEVLYKLYLIAKEVSQSDAEHYSQQLKNNYPSSTFAKILINPNYLKETSVAVEKQKLVYKEAYNEFAAGNLRLSQDKINQAKTEGETTFTPQLELLEILITGKTEDITQYQFQLTEFIKKYPDSELKSYAANLLASSKKLLERTEKAKAIRFVNSLEEPHYLIIVYKTENALTDQFTQVLENFNNQSFKGKNLKTSNLKFDDTQSITFVSEVPDRTMAIDYFEKLRLHLTNLNSLANYKFDTFVITKDNFQIFYRTKALDEYLTFFDRNYQTKNQ
jgi:tetratricopeptide (TPR) repeat protein